MATGIKILKASYGTGSSVVDVTASVTSHIRDGELSVVVTPDAFGVVDPAPGQLKTLTVDYSVNNGSKNTETAKDNEILTINAPPEQVASGLQVTKAEYGYPGNLQDVTDALQNYISNGSISLKVSPATVGLPDPNPNKRKQLTVEYTLNGSKNSKTFNDGETFKVSAPPATQVDNKTPSQHVLSLAGSLFYGVVIFFGIALQTLSVLTSYKFGGFILAGVAFVIPFFSFWALPLFLFWRRIFLNSDLVVNSDILSV